MRGACIVMLGLFVALPAASLSATAAEVPKKLKLKGPRATCESLDFSPDGKLLAAGYGHSGVRVFDALTGKVVLSVSRKKDELVYMDQIAFSADGTELFILMSARFEARIDVWSIVDKKKSRTIPDVPAGSGSMAVAPDGSSVVVSGMVGKLERDTAYVVAIDLAAGGKRTTLEEKYPYRPRVVFAPDGKTLFAEDVPFVRRGSYETTGVKAYDTKSWKVAREYKSLILDGISFAPDGSRFYGGGPGAVETYETKGTGREPIASWKAHGKNRPRTACSHDGALVVSWYHAGGGKRDPWLCIFSTETGRRLKRMKPDPKQVSAAAFAPRTRRLAVGGDVSLRIYDLSDLKTGK